MLMSSGTLFIADASKRNESLPSGPLMPHKEQTPSASKRRKKIALPLVDGFVFEKLSHIVYLEADGNYAHIYLSDGRKMLLSRTLGDMSKILPEDAFVRIHRSFIVNLRHVARYIRNKYGSVVLSNGTVLNVSPHYRKAFVEAMSRYFCGFQP